MAADLGSHIITHFRTDDLADAAADSSPGARTVASTNRTTLEDANHSTLATTLFDAFERTHFRAVVPTLASADDAAEPRAVGAAFNHPETDVLWWQSAAVHGAHDAAVRRTHCVAFSGTDAQKNCKAHNSTDGLHER